MVNQRLIRNLGPPKPNGSARVHLHGAVITPNDFVSDGTVILAGDRIAEVVSSRVPGSEGDLDVETEGLICPGFVDTHNHAAYAGFTRWGKPSRYFRGRFDWRGKTRCGVIVVPEPDNYYSTHVSQPYKAISAAPGMLGDLILYGQVRGVVGGATTMVIDADLNPHNPALPGPIRGPDGAWGILDVGCVQDKQLQEIIDDLTANSAKLLVHVGEGTDEFARGEFLALANKGLLTSNTAVIHALALLEPDLRLLKSRGASIIWSPASNFRLYGRSIDIGQVLGAGIRVALAPDWTITGSSTMLDELAFVRARYNWIPDETLLDMVTRHPADLMGKPALGRIEQGALADILVFPAPPIQNRASAAQRIVTSSPSDVSLVLVRGSPVYGVPALIEQFPDGTFPRETVSLPLANGTYVSRLLQLDHQRSFAAVVATLTTAFTAQNIPFAPLWEAT